MISQVVSEEPADVFMTPGPRVVTLPAMLDSRLHKAGLPQVPLSCGL